MYKTGRVFLFSLFPVDSAHFNALLPLAGKRQQCLVFTSGNDEYVYLHIEQGSEIQSQVVKRDQCRDAWYQVETHLLRAVHLWWHHSRQIINQVETVLMTESFSLRPAVNYFFATWRQQIPAARRHDGIDIWFFRVDKMDFGEQLLISIFRNKIITDLKSCLYPADECESNNHSLLTLYYVSTNSY